MEEWYKLSFQVAIIGSFRKYYKEILELIKLFKGYGLYVWSPKESEICDSIEDFVIFKSDNPEYTPAEIQTITLERILRADMVYVYNPHGYIGRTTCYEIGFCLSRCKPIYFFEEPKDLPIHFVKSKQILLPEEFCNLVCNNSGEFIVEYNLCSDASNAFKKIYGINTLNEPLTKKIVICGSMNFYSEMIICQHKLKELGIESIIPKEENDIVQMYNESQFIDFKKKVSNAYLKKIRDKSTTGVLIFNGQKHGKVNYIGANTLVELAMAFAWHRKIFLFNDIYEPLKDELLAWGCICLNGDLDKIQTYLNKTENTEKNIYYEQLSFLN